MKLAIRLVALVLLGALLVLVGSRGRSVSRRGSPEVAVAGERALTQEDLERRIQSLPEKIQAGLEDPDRQLDLLNHMIDELVMVQAAESMGLDRDPEFRGVLDDARRQMLSNFYRERVLRPRSVPDSADVRRYYAEHPEEFTVVERVTGKQVVRSTEEEARQVRERLLAGEDFQALLSLSTDEHTRKLGGWIGIVSRAAPVRGLGRNDAFIEALLALETGEISEPIRTELGYHVVVIESHDAERVRSLVTVWESLARRLQPARFREIYETDADSLRDAYGVTIYEQVLYGEEQYRTEQAKQLFEQAQSATDPRARLAIYQQILDLEVESRYAAQARFMRGFVYFEELGDTELGRAELNRVIEDYPESDLVDSARWMLENKNQSIPADSAATGRTGTDAISGGK